MTYERRRTSYPVGGAESTLWRDYGRGRDYQASIGLDRRLPMYVRFYEGDQWPRATWATRHMPRPVENVVRFIVRNKTAQLRAGRAKLIYHGGCEEMDARQAEAIRRLNCFSDRMRREMRMEELDRKAINDGAVKGTYVYHYYWDREAHGVDGAYEGALRCEVLDPLRVFFADPTEKDEQRQKWILITSREPVEAVRARADAGVDLRRIVADEESDGITPDDTAAGDGEAYCTVLTRYFRRGGEVFFEIGTRYCIVNAARPLVPDVEGARRRLFPSQVAGEMDEPAGGAPCVPGSESRMDAGGLGLPESGPSACGPVPGIRRMGATLYPVVVGNYEETEGSIYGMGEVQGIIPIQKAINENLAMILLGIRMSFGGKYVVDKAALRNQVITTEPGQTLVDYSGTGNGIRQLPGVEMPAMPLTANDNMMSTLRVLTGVSEVMSGEMAGRVMSGAAYAQLQAQALIPIEDLRDALWRVKEKQAMVEMQFYRLFYHDFCFLSTDPSGSGRQVRDVFEGDDYVGMPIAVQAEAVGGARASVAGDIALLDTLLDKGAISPETYVRAYPREAISDRERLLTLLKEERREKVDDAV